MKPIQRPLFALLALMLASLLALSACGQTGPLYLPDDQTDSTRGDRNRSKTTY